MENSPVSSGMLTTYRVWNSLHIDPVYSHSTFQYGKSLGNTCRTPFSIYMLGYMLNLRPKNGPTQKTKTHHSSVFFFSSLSETNRSLRGWDLSFKSCLVVNVQMFKWRRSQGHQLQPGGQTSHPRTPLMRYSMGDPGVVVHKNPIFLTGRWWLLVVGSKQRCFEWHESWNTDCFIRILVTAYYKSLCNWVAKIFGHRSGGGSGSGSSWGGQKKTQAVWDAH